MALVICALTLKGGVGKTTTAVALAESAAPALAVLTMVRTGLPEREGARSALGSWGVPVAATELPLAVSVQRASGQQVTGLLARFGLDLLAEILDLTQPTKGASDA